jgi:hypothetical protein
MDYKDISELAWEAVKRIAVRVTNRDRFSQRHPTCAYDLL